MSASVKTWVDGTAPTCAAADLNGFKLENNNLIEGAGITLSNTDRQQTHDAVAAYVAVGDFYTGGGAADAYTAALVSPRRGIWALQNGQQIRFVVPATNTGASTLNVNGLGVKNLKKWDGSALVACDILAGEIITVIYNLANTEWRLVNKDSILSIVPPIGSIIPFDDFDGAVTFDSNYYAYMDGAVLSDALSPLNGETLRDLSGRYLVGFGTDGGEDIDSVAWSAGPVGNAGHQIDIAHTHTGPSHTHGEGTLYACLSNAEASVIRAKFVLVDSYTWNSQCTADGNWSAGPNDITTGVDVLGTTGSGGTGATSSSLSATQTIQPRSIPVRFLVRKR